MYTKTKRQHRALRGTNVKKYDPKVLWSEVLFLRPKSIVSKGIVKEVVYDFNVPGKECFFANSILCHNTTWIMGSRFGETHIDNGRHFVALNRTHHHIRKRFKGKSEEMFGVEYSKISGRRNKDFDINVANLRAWMRFMHNYYKIADKKLTNKPVEDYRIRNFSTKDLPDFYVPLKERERYEFPE